MNYIKLEDYPTFSKSIKLVQRMRAFDEKLKSFSSTCELLEYIGVGDFKKENLYLSLFSIPMSGVVKMIPVQCDCYRYDDIIIVDGDSISAEEMKRIWHEHSTGQNRQAVYSVIYCQHDRRYASRCFIVYTNNTLRRIDIHPSHRVDTHFPELYDKIITQEEIDNFKLSRSAIMMAYSGPLWKH